MERYPDAVGRPVRGLQTRMRHESGFSPFLCIHGDCRHATCLTDLIRCLRVKAWRCITATERIAVVVLSSTTCFFLNLDLQLLKQVSSSTACDDFCVVWLRSKDSTVSPRGYL